MEVKVQLREGLRFMLLPVPSAKEDVCAEAIGEILSKHGVDDESFLEFLSQKHELWLTEKKLDPILKKAITAALTVSDSDIGTLLAAKYFDIHSSLISNPFISSELSIVVLSHLRMINHLAEQERMSAAKVAKVLQATDRRLSTLSWKQISSILRSLGKLPQLESVKVSTLFSEDEHLQAEYFADAGLEDGIRLINDKGKALQFPGNIGRYLSSMTRPGQVHLPYLQILHYQTLISAFYDHVPTTPYEFNPRGQIANWLFSKWDALLHTSNPILNNAKAVDVLDENWARSRGSNEYEQASALVEILKGLDGMGYAAAQELASWVRRWLVRYISTESTTIVPLPNNLSSKAVSGVLDVIASKPTATFGILEQRYMDLIAATLYPKESGWRSRGLLDAVNSNNFAKRKLGDCDFQNAAKKEVIAYEAHGGVLNRIYFDGHARTFRRALHRRREELESVADLDHWKFTVNFIAYGFEPGLPNHFMVDGIKVTCKFVTLVEFGKEIDKMQKERDETFNELFVTSLNDRKTPSEVREKIRAYLANIKE